MKHLSLELNNLQIISKF